MMKRRGPWLASEKQLRHEVETEEKSSLGQSDKEVSVPNHPFNSKFPTAGALFFGALGKEDGKNGCTFCDGPHPSDTCKIVPTIDKRLEFLRNQKRGFRCFKREVICQSPATRRSVVRGANITQRCVNLMKFFGICLESMLS